MSDPASFWAAKSKGVKSPLTQADASTPSAQCEPVKAHFPPLKSASNGVKKPNWADSDDEGEFLASLASPGRTAELENALVANDARITDLLASLQEKRTHIAELESASEKQATRLSDLEGAIEASAAQIEELKKQTHRQALHVERLVADVDEKDRRIAALETEVYEHCATIAELDRGDSSTQISSHDAPETLEVISIDPVPPKAKVEEDAANSGQQATQPKTDGQSGDEAAVTPPSTTASAEPAGPAANLSAFPTFATAKTIKQTAPAPPAPKLKMPLDMSKFVKKSATKPVAMKKKTIAPLANAVKDGPAPDIDPSSDIRIKSRDERVLFANGPKVQVKMGEIVLATISKYVLMQCSHKAFKHFSEEPDSASFNLPPDSMDATAATAHLIWMQEMTFQHRVYSITLHSDEKFDDKNLQICRASRVLGLNSMYVGHFTKIFCDRIRANTASDGLFPKVAEAAYPENDPIYDCLANNLANSRLHGTAKRLAAVEALLQNNEALKTRVEKIEARMRKKQDGPKPAKVPKVVQVGKSKGV